LADVLSNLLQSDTRNTVGFALDGLQHRHMAIGSNVANAETPGYKAVDVQFEQTLQAHLAQKTDAGDLGLLQTHHRHLNGHALASDAALTGGSDAFQIQTQYRADGNGVDMDKEMAYLAQTSQRFLALSQIEGKMYKSLRGLITNNG
jgi:flagellar basal-body rod protein FlgB